MSTRTMKTFTAALLASGLLLSAPAAAGALDLGSLDTGSLGTGSLTPQTPTNLVDTPRLATVANFRDVAGNTGAGYAAANGHHLKRGVIYRSDAPTKTSEADLTTLTDLGVADAYDLRGQSEITNPLVGGTDKLPASTVYKNVPIDFSNLIQLAQTITSPEQAAQFLVDTNKSFVTDAAKRAQFATVLTDIANNDGAQLFHCTSGKDRTGWTAMLLQSLAGLPQQTIMDDYLLSNTYLAATNQKILQQITGALGAQAATNLTPILGVDASYLQAGLDQITADYGTVGKYLSDGLGLDKATLAKLKAKLVA
ncbi:tyrosine-protein phosphatase [Rhodococcus sp. NPDC127528]|uniref:tyrosine-protein phosphatase n=1 Tax=unclassified Rhodococcus (in: high G+C Gram-positive bacteria) TaxID=192944 RepID=UPI00363CF959